MHIVPGKCTSEPAVGGRAPLGDADVLGQIDLVRKLRSGTVGGVCAWSQGSLRRRRSALLFRRCSRSESRTGAFLPSCTTPLGLGVCYYSAMAAARARTVTGLSACHASMPKAPGLRLSALMPWTTGNASPWLLTLACRLSGTPKRPARWLVIGTQPRTLFRGSAHQLPTWASPWEPSLECRQWERRRQSRQPYSSSVVSQPEEEYKTLRFAPFS